MSDPAPMITPAARTYRGELTQPERWRFYHPRRGDVLVVTPAKCGTTWTQTMIAMLLNGGPDLPGRISTISPWVDADITPGHEVEAELEGQAGRRVIKTHTPMDGVPIWDGVHVVAVFRHPLDMFFSLRKHIANRESAGDHPMKGPVDVAVRWFISREFEPDNVDRDCVQSVTEHFLQVARSDRVKDPILLHYATMLADGRAAVAQLADRLGVAASEAQIDAIAQASSFGAMKAKASQFAPEGGKGFWKDDAAFFDSAGLGKWAGQIPDDALRAYSDRMADLVGPEDRAWIENGGPLPPVSIES